MNSIHMKQKSTISNDAKYQQQLWEKIVRFWSYEKREIVIP